MSLLQRGAVLAAVAAVFASVWLVGCQRQPPEPYVRLSGAAPAFADAPPGRALLVTFWATWCPYCVEEIEALRALTAKPPADLAVVVVSEDKELAVVSAFFGGTIPPGLHLRLDEEWRTAHALRVDQLPTSVLIIDGQAVARFDGARQWDSLGARSTLTRLITATPRETP